MIQFQAPIEKFKNMGEKSGWSYVAIQQTLAHQICPNQKKSFRVKGLLDDVKISGVAILPIGDGDFVMALKQDLRKKLRKEAGAILQISLELDLEIRRLDPDFEACLEEDHVAFDYFKTLAHSHQMYFSNWISEAKTTQTKETRIVESLRAFHLKWDFSQMIRARKKNVL